MDLNDCLSIFVALLALFVSIWNVIETRKHQQLSVTPKLGLATKFRGRDGDYGVRINNYGLGPATIISITLFLDGKSVKNRHDFWLRALQDSGLDLFCWHVQRPYLDETIRVDEHVWLLRCDKFDQESNDVIRALNRLKVEVIYESMYKKKQPILVSSLADLSLLVEDPSLLGKYLI